MTTGERISKLRESRNVLQKDLARAINIDPVVLNRIEKGKRSTRDEELRKIADYFNVSTDYLLGRDVISRSLSKTQTNLLDGFGTLNNEGQNLVMAILGSLKMSHAKQKKMGIIQNSENGNNYGVVGGNFSSNVILG